MDYSQALDLEKDDLQKGHSVAEKSIIVEPGKRTTRIFQGLINPLNRWSSNQVLLYVMYRYLNLRSDFEYFNNKGEHSKDPRDLQKNYLNRVLLV